jgi:conjugal transfer pilin signal peptidase TrbI
MPLAADFNVITYNRQLVNAFKKKCPKPLLKKIGFSLFLIFMIYGLAVSQIQLALNVTPSLPHKLFVFSKRNTPSLKAPSKDQFILFYKPEMGIDVVKHVKGVAGSQIHYDEQGHLWVDDFYVGKPHATSSKGVPVTAIQAGVIPPNYVFAYGSHDRSFDSRYAEFGLVPVGIIKGVGVALL